MRAHRLQRGYFLLLFVRQFLIEISQFRLCSQFHAMGLSQCSLVSTCNLSNASPDPRKLRTLCAQRTQDSQNSDSSSRRKSKRSSNSNTYKREEETSTSSILSVLLSSANFKYFSSFVCSCCFFWLNCRVIASNCSVASASLHSASYTKQNASVSMCQEKEM